MARLITGDKAVIRNLNTLANRVQRKILRKVVRRVSKPMVADARGRVRRRTGQLAKSLGTIVRTYRGTNVTAVTGPRGGFRIQVDGETIDPVKYAHLLEEQYPFLGPAFDGHESTARSSAMQEIAKEIEKEAEREAKKK